MTGANYTFHKFLNLLVVGGMSMDSVWLAGEGRQVSGQANNFCHILIIFPLYRKGRQGSYLVCWRGVQDGWSCWWRIASMHWGTSWVVTQVCNNLFPVMEFTIYYSELQISKISWYRIARNMELGVMVQNGWSSYGDHALGNPQQWHRCVEGFFVLPMDGI